MINHYDPNLFINKSVLAKMAGVSTRTFRRYLAKRRPVLESMGISAKAQKQSAIFAKIIALTSKIIA